MLVQEDDRACELSGILTVVVASGAGRLTLVDRGLSDPPVVGSFPAALTERDARLRSY
jgi:hypothetical protein